MNKFVCIICCNFFCMLLLSRITSGQQNRYISDAELRSWSEELFSKDTTVSENLFSISFQGKAQYNSTTDFASRPLFNVDKKIFNIETIGRLMALYDNYEPHVLDEENVTPTEKAEESAYLDAVIKTNVMKHLKNLLQSKGYINGINFKNFLSTLWFTVYSREQRKLGSSAFEHIFLGEIKRQQVSGFHSWLFFSFLENNQRVNYLGWLKKLEFGNQKKGLLKFNFKWRDLHKPVNSMFVGTSPELEMAVYTLCFLARPDNKCHLKMGGKTFTIQTFVFSRPNLKLIASAYPLF